MKPATIPLLLPLFFVAPLAHPQTDVYVCLNADGSRQYKNTSEGIEGCKRVDVQGISMLPSPYKKAESLKPKQWPQLSLGMNKTTVEKAWGKPSSKRKVQTRENTIEEWKYAGHAKLTFQNGTLEVIEE
jgi:hypothetical protein